MRFLWHLSSDPMSGTRYAACTALVSGNEEDKRRQRTLATLTSSVEILIWDALTLPPNETVLWASQCHTRGQLCGRRRRRTYLIFQYASTVATSLADCKVFVIGAKSVCLRPSIDSTLLGCKSLCILSRGIAYLASRTASIRLACGYS